MLTQDEKENNKKRFIDGLVKYVPNHDALLEELGDGVFEAAYNRFNFMNNSYAGGLVENALKVVSYAVKQNNMLTNKVDLNSLIKTCLIAELGLYNLYVKSTSDWHIKNQGKIYDWVDEKDTSLRLGERTVFLLQKCGVSLTKDEFTAIVNLNKPSDDPNTKWDRNMLSVILITATKLAIADQTKSQVQ